MPVPSDDPVASTAASTQTGGTTTAVYTPPSTDVLITPIVTTDITDVVSVDPSIVVVNGDETLAEFLQLTPLCDVGFIADGRPTAINIYKDTLPGSLPVSVWVNSDDALETAAKFVLPSVDVGGNIINATDAAFKAPYIELGTEESLPQPGELICNYKLDCRKGATVDGVAHFNDVLYADGGVTVRNVVANINAGMSVKGDVEFKGVAGDTMCVEIPASFCRINVQSSNVVLGQDSDGNDITLATDISNINSSLETLRSRMTLLINNTDTAALDSLNELIANYDTYTRRLTDVINPLMARVNLLTTFMNTFSQHK